MVKSKYIVCYDIVENNIRTQVSELCKDYGLERIQYSVFYGSLTPDQFRELQFGVKDTINGYNANVHFISLCGSCEQKHRVQVSINIEEEENTDIIETEFDEKPEFEDEVIIV